MQTACLLRRSWSHLHTVSRGIAIARTSCAESSSRTRAGSHSFICIVRERFFSVSVNDTKTLSPFRSSGQIGLRLAVSGHEYWCTNRSNAVQGGFKKLPSGLSRFTGAYGGLCSSEDANARRQARFVSCESRYWSELASYTKDQDQDQEEEVPGIEMEDKEGLKGVQWMNSNEKDDCEFVHPLDEVRKPITMGDEHFGYPSSVGIAQRVLPRSRLGSPIFTPPFRRSYSSVGSPPANSEGTGVADTRSTTAFHYSQRAVVTALATNFLVFSLKLGVWIVTSSHVMLAEAIHSLADLANQGLIAYGLYSSRRAPDAIHPYGYTKERFVWSLISAVGIFCLGAGATIIHGVQNLWNAEPLENIHLAAFVIIGSVILEGASLLVAISCVRNGAKAEGMTVKDYLWRGHDPTSVAVMMEDGAAVTGLAIAGLALTAAHYTGNPMWDPIGSIVVGNLLGAVAIFLIQRNRHALLGRSMDEQDMMRVLTLLSKDPVVDAIYDCKSEVIGPGAYRFKAEIDFNGVTIVQNYIRRAGRGNWHKEFKDAVSSPEPGHLDRVMAAYGEEIVSALGGEVDRLEREIQKVVPGIRHVDIEAHNPNGPLPREKLYLPYRSPDKLISK